jgi:hypothetical protein
MSESSIDVIKARVVKLMALANGEGATEAEIESAMRFAAKLIDQHHIDVSDLNSGETPQPENIQFGKVGVSSQFAGFAAWESTLLAAVNKLFGTTKAFLGDSTPIRVNGIVQRDKNDNVRYGKEVCFYGPLTDVQEASSLYVEWSRSIATMGITRWGGAYRGDGAMYCQGFARSIYEQSVRLNSERQLTMVKPPAQLTNQTTAITLLNKFDLIQSAAAEWLENEAGVKLSGGSRRSGASGSREAYNEGRRHGSQAQFGRNAKRKQLQ